MLGTPAWEHVIDPETENQLIERAARGSHDAFAQLVRAHQGAVRAFVSRFVDSATEIDDIAQDSFLAAFRSLGDYSGIAAFRTWLIGIARHRALSFLRDRQRRLEREQRLVDAALAEAREQALEQAPDDIAEQLAALQDCLGQLPEQQRQLIDARYLHQTAIADLADGLGKQTGAVRVALHRLRTALRHCVEGKLQEAR